MSTTLPIPTDFICSYNGFTHDPATALTTALNVKVIESADGRTASYNQIYLRISSEIRGTPTDAAVLAARQRLTKFGGILIYDGRGFGPLQINTGRVRDIKFGPKPKVLSVKFLGSKYACRLDWEVEVHIPECSDARYSLGILDLSYRMEFLIRVDGRVNRQVTGTLRIPNNRTMPGSDQVLDSPDLYRDRIATPPAWNFRREWQPFRISPDRVSLDFGWIDREFGRNVYPAGVVRMEAPHTVDQEHPGAAIGTGIGAVPFKATLRATITVDAQHDSRAAIRAFWGLVDQRVRQKQRAGFQEPTPRGGARPVVFIPWHVSFGEPNILGEELVCDFSFTYRILPVRLKNIVAASGLWEPIDTDWGEWYRSVANSALSAYGISKLTFTPDADQLVDLCQPNPRGLRQPGQARRAVPQQALGGIAWPEIEEAGSWLRYYNQLIVEPESGTVAIRPLAQTNPPLPPPTSTPAELRGGTLQPREAAPAPRPVASDPNGYQSLSGAIAEKVGRVPGFGKSAGGTGVGAGRGKGNPPPDGGAQGKDPPGPNDVAIQRRTPPRVVLYLIGSALRIGFEVPPPSLGDVDGITPVLDCRPDMGEGFATAIVGQTATGVPIFGAKWKLRYVLPQQPAGPVLPPDPASWLGRRLG